MTEVMLSLTTGAIVLAASLDTFNVLHRQALQQQRAIVRQQDLRIGLEVLEQEIHVATSGSIVTATPDEFEFNANINAQYTTTMAAIAPGQLLISVLDGSGWGAGKTVRFCGLNGCESHRLSRAGQKSQLTLTEPVSQPFTAGTAVEVMNRVTYYTKRDDRGLVTLMRMVDGGASSLMGELEGVRFSYWNARGDAASGSLPITRVVVKVQMRGSRSNIVKEVALRS